MSDDANPESSGFLAQRRTWLAGGILLLLSVVVEITARGPLAGLSPAKAWIFAAAGIVLAIGLGRAGSVTARRIVGTLATVLLVIAPLTQSYWYTLLPDNSDDPHAAEDGWALVAMIYYGVVVILAVISVVEIARAKVIPSPWRWAPLWVMIWTPLTFTVGLFFFSSAPLGSPVASFGAVFSLYAPAAGVAFLGIMAIVLGMRRRETQAPRDAERDALPRHG